VNGGNLIVIRPWRKIEPVAHGDRFKARRLARCEIWATLHCSRARVDPPSNAFEASGGLNIVVSGKPDSATIVRHERGIIVTGRTYDDPVREVAVAIGHHDQPAKEV